MNTASTEIYLPDDLYDAVVERLAVAVPLLGSRDDLVARLGEILNIWPERAASDEKLTPMLRAA